MQRVAVITGSSRGIGSETAIKLAKSGFCVVINYVQNEKAADETLKICGEFSRAIKVKADVSNPLAVKRLYAESKAAFGTVDTLINNAGISHTKLLIDQTDEDLNRIIGVNLLGAFHTSRAFLPDMMSARFGRIVNVSSIWGITGASMEAAYSASKAGLIGLTKALSKEVAPMGVTVNAVAPGLILTDMTKHLSGKIMDSLVENIPVGRVGLPQDIASAIVFLCDENASYISGEVLSVTGDLLSAAI